MRHGIYPVSSYDKNRPKGKEYTVSFNEVLESKDEIERFMINGGV